MNRGVRLGRIGHVEVFADWSLLIIFVLVVMSLGAGVLPAWHPQWTLGLVWATALVGAVLFFVSILVHELSHAFVGRLGGASIRRITLFVFGGMAHLDSEPPTWRSELSMALAGPAMSLVIGFTCLWSSGFMTAASAGDQAQALRWISDAEPVATVLMWLGSINILLGLFNLVPGFPLDGGRVLRALAWGISGDFGRATRFAAVVGQFIAWLLIAAGIAMMLGMRVPLFGAGFVNGVWLALIGWFLNTAALTSSRRLAIENALEDVPITRIMRSNVQSVGPATTVAELIDRYVVASGQRIFPVVEAERLIGVVRLQDVTAVAAQARSSTPVGNIAKGADDKVTLPASASARRAADLLARPDVEDVFVTDGERIVGMVGRESLMTWLSLNSADRSAKPAPAGAGGWAHNR